MLSQEPTKVRPQELGIAPSLPLEFAQRATQLAPTVDLETPIGRKWSAAGGASFLGKPLELPETTPSPDGMYQQFQKGVIFYHPAYGAIVVSNPIFSKWNSLTSALKRTIGCPVKDQFKTPGGGEAVYCEKGMIVVRPDGKAFEIHGNIYVRYRDLQDVNSVLGLPLSDEEAFPKGGRRSRFDKGDIYFHSATGAREVHGAIRGRWQALGGAEGFMGYPETDELPVYKDGKKVGRFNRFQGGTIYWSPKTGAWEVHGAIRSVWENDYNGAAGILGFPTSDETPTPTSGGRFNNFENGILIWHPGGHPLAGVHILCSLEFYLDRFASKGGDGGRGAQDLYVKVDVHASTGQRFNKRLPNDGDFGGDQEIDRVFISVPVVQGDLVIDVKLEGWDSDFPDGDDRLGTVDERYTVDNLWGLFENAEHWRKDFLAVYKLRNPMPLDPNQEFRQQLFWSFDNFKTAELKVDQYAQTFRDVDDLKFSFLDPSTWRPFDRLFYQVYKGVAANGNCFGMCLESIYAQVGRSVFSEPIYRFGPKGNIDPDPVRDRDLIREINLKHGYQMGGEAVDWFLAEFVQGHTHNPVHAFKSSRAMYQRGDYPIMVVTNSAFKVGGHVVRPYEWDDRNPDLWTIYITDPNVPYEEQKDKRHERCRIEVLPKTNTFRYCHGTNDLWTGGTWTGGRMYPIPFSVLSRQPRTPFWEVLALISAGTFILLGNEGATEQISDDRSRTFYEPDLAGTPTQWQHIRQDATKRIPNMARIPVLSEGAMPELYYVTGQSSRNLQQEIATRSGQPYQWGMHSAALSAMVMTTGKGSTETLQVEDLNSGKTTIALVTPESGRDRSLTLALAGGIDKTKQFEMRELLVQSRQTVKARLDEGGEALMLENDGPETTFELHVQAGIGNDSSSARPRRVTLEAGKAARLRPADWVTKDMTQVPMQLDVFDDVRGPVKRRIEL